MREPGPGWGETDVDRTRGVVVHRDVHVLQDGQDLRVRYLRMAEQAELLLERTEVQHICDALRLRDLDAVSAPPLGGARGQLRRGQLRSVRNVAVG
jgi:hypothetical protein